MTPKQTVEHANQFPYDDAGDGDEPPIFEPGDWAIKAARGVIEDLLDRRGIKWAFQEVEDVETRQEIVRTLAEIIRYCDQNRAAL